MTNNTVLHLSKTHTNLITWTLLCLMPIIGMAVDLVAPSLPAISTGLKISAGITKGIISIYLLGYAMGNFFTGFLTDAFGRKKLIRVALGSFIFASLIPIFFPHAGLLLFARFLQGITLGATAVLARAIISDVLPAEKLVHIGTLLGTMWGLGPVIGPLLGGYLQYYFGWKAGFCFFAVVAFLALITVFFIVPETHFNRHPLNIKTIRQNMKEILCHKTFIALVVIMGFAYSLIISFNTVGPFLIQDILHYSPVFFGHAALCLGLVFLAGTFICRHLIKYFSADLVIPAIIYLFFTASIILLISAYFFPYSIALIMIASAMMFFATSFLFPLSVGKGMSMFRHIAGTATATMYLLNVLICSLTSFLLSFIDMHNTLQLMAVYVSILFFCLICYKFLFKQPVQKAE